MKLVVDLGSDGASGNGGAAGKSHENLLFKLLREAGIPCELVERASPHKPAGATVQVRVVQARSNSFSGSGLGVTGSAGSSQGKTEVDKLRRELAARKQEIRDLEENLSIAMDSIKTFHKQQNELFDEFVSLRDKYDTHKAKFRRVLWEFVPQNVAGFENIPSVAESIDEAEDRVGAWHTGKVLGEGQFAVVKEVRSGPQQKCGLQAKDIAVKRILKDKITDIKNAARINNEVGILRDLQHPAIVKLVDVLHTPNYLYLVQERGGLDLFEYYRRHPGPAKESFARSILSQLSSAVAYLSKHNVAHRDLKPENVLIGEDDTVKLVDFGLSTLHRTDMTLDDFCGTPGFFAPEMLLQSTYDSYKLDIWSLGCVMLEILLGHVRFAEVWMPAYAFEHLHDANEFERELNKSLVAVRAIFDTKAASEKAVDSTLLFKNHKAKDACQRALREQRSRSAPCKSLVLNMLSPQPADRISAEALAATSYVHAVSRRSDSEVSVGSTEEQHPNQRTHRPCVPASPKSPGSPKEDLLNALSGPEGSSPSTGSSSGLFLRRGGSSSSTTTVDFAKAEKAKPEEKASKLCINTAAPAQERARLPPLSPASPKVEGVQELVKIGDALMSKHELHL